MVLGENKSFLCVYFYFALTAVKDNARLHIYCVRRVGERSTNADCIFRTADRS